MCGTMQRSLGHQNSTRSDIYQPVQLMSRTVDFAGVAPIDEQHHIHVAFAALYL